MDLSNLKLTELAVVYNNLIKENGLDVSQVKKFSDKPSALKRINKLLESIQEEQKTPVQEEQKTLVQEEQKTPVQEEQKTSVREEQKTPKKQVKRKKQTFGGSAINFDPCQGFGKTFKEGTKMHFIVEALKLGTTLPALMTQLDITFPLMKSWDAHNLCKAIRKHLPAKGYGIITDWVTVESLYGDSAENFIDVEPDQLVAWYSLLEATDSELT